MKNKKGVTLFGWTESILLSILVVLLIVAIIGSMNVKYGQDNQLGLGGNSTLSAYANYQSTLEDEIKGGEADFSSGSGLTLKSSWNIVKTSGSITWDFITGVWIKTIVIDYMGLPQEVATVFQILYFLSVGFIILRILFKITP